MSKRIPKKILVFGTFPIVEPRHGGQKRVQAIVAEYQKHFTQVKFLAVYSRWANPAAARTDIPVSHATDRLIQASGRYEDLMVGESIFTDPKIKRRLTRFLLEFKPDVIQIEQIYPYIGLKPLLDELGLHPHLVFDTHNVESDMKRLIYETAGLPPAEVAELTARLADWERDLVGRARLTVAVSPADLEAFAALGARHALLAPNGIYPAAPAPAAEATWRRRFAAAGINRTLLYVSSAHLPNWISFREIIGEGLGFIPPDARLLLAGGLARFLTTQYKWVPTPGATTFWLRAWPLGILPEDRLTGLIATADCLLLPITTGGGSNLKTAEALLSGKPIVATSYAFRAYEEFMDLPTVTVADTPDAFRAALVTALNNPDPAPTLTPEQTARLATTVTWPHTLQNLIQEVAAL